MPTIQDVARLAGVSPTTAKRALREPDKLTPDTLIRVQQAIDQLHYEPDQRAGGLRGGQSSTIGLIVGSILEPFFAQFARTASHVLAEAGYTLIISENEYSARLELADLRRLYGQRVAGIMLRPGYGHESRDYLARLAARGVCIVQYDYVPPGSPYPSVTLDNVGATHLAVQHLYGYGHRRIASLATYHPVLHPDERSRTFPEAMAALGLHVPPEYQQVLLPSEETGYTRTHELLSLSSPPSALIVVTGTQAIGAYRAIRERGLRIPDDVSLVTFDNYPWTALVEPPITVLEQPAERMATATVRQLLESLSRGSPDPAHVRHERFPGRLIVRGSCAAPAQQLAARS